MNIFILSTDPVKAAQQHNDKHVVKMIVESAQMLCTAHRVLDGGKVEYQKKTPKGKFRKATKWQLPDRRDDKLYRATHINHPCSIWCRETVENYMWLHALTVALCDEYYHRYGKHHKVPRQHKVQASGMLDLLATPPRNIPCGGLTPFAIAMPDQYKVDDVIQSYKNYYLGEKTGFMKYTHREMPEWVKKGLFKNTLKHGHKKEDTINDFLPIG